MTDPTFTIEEDKVGIGCCVVVQWQDGRREVVTGFGNHSHADQWVRSDSERWLRDFPKQVQGKQWINDRLPKAD
jgi:hypothetical protein